MFEVWVLDDQYVKVVASRLLQGGWLWEDTETGSTRGLRIKAFDTLKNFREQLNAVVHPRDIPLLALLDVDLGDKGGEYGGFEAWRALEAMHSRLQSSVPSMARAQRCKAVMYTRAPRLVELAKYLSAEPANPIVLPFAGSDGETALKGGLSDLDDTIDRHLRAFRRWFLSQPAVKRPLPLDADWRRTAWSGVTVDAIFPREVYQAEAEARTGVGNGQVWQDKVRAVCDAPPMGFREAYHDLVWHFDRSDDARVGRYSTDNVIGHFLGAPKMLAVPGAIELARLLVNEACDRWTSALECEHFHLPGILHFRCSALWRQVQQARTAATADLFVALHEMCRECDNGQWQGRVSVMYSKAEEKLGWPDNFHALGVHVEDMCRIEDELTGNYRGTFGDTPTALNLRQRIDVHVGERWCGLGRSPAVEYNVRIGMAGNADWRPLVLGGMTNARAVGGLRMLRRMVCEIYGGQLAVIEAGGRGVVAGVLCYGGGEPRVMSDQDRLRISENLQGCVLKKGEIYDVISFGAIERGEVQV